MDKCLGISRGNCSQVIIEEDMHRVLNDLLDCDDDLQDNVSSESETDESDLESVYYESPVTTSHHRQDLETINTSGYTVPFQISQHTVPTNRDLSHQEIDDSVLSSSHELNRLRPRVLKKENRSHDEARTWGNTNCLRNLNFSPSPTFLAEDQVNHKDPINFFNLFFTDYFYDKIVEETNRYAVSLFLRPGVTEHSRITAWKPVTREEIKMFLGLLFHMGNIRINRLADYWKQPLLFNMPIFKNTMSRNRFLIILRCLHFSKSDVNEQLGNCDRLLKINVLVNYFNDTMKSICYPGKQLCIDESVMLWRGRLLFKQYIKNKRHKYGIKMYFLTEPKGLVHKLLVDSGPTDPILSGKNHGKKVVFNLLSDKLNNGHSVYLDNYYTSCSLAEDLLLQKTYCTGPIRINRAGLPECVKSSTLRKGQAISRFSSTGLCVGKWQDKHEVLMLSTEHSFDFVGTQTKRGYLQKPKSVIEYNKYISDIDVQEQLLAYYSCERTKLRWYKKLAIHIFQLMLLNAYHLYNRFTVGTKLSLYNFRLAVIENLIQPVKITREISKPISGLHEMKKIQKRTSKGDTSRRRCRYCSTQGKRTSSIYYCSGCPENPALCAVCFNKYHAQITITL